MAAPWTPPPLDRREGPCRCRMCVRRRVAAADARPLTGPQIAAWSLSGIAIGHVLALAICGPAAVADALLVALGMR